MRGFKIAKGDLGQQIRVQGRECDALKAWSPPCRSACRSRRCCETEIVKLAPEAKHLTDTIKMVAYRAETALVGSGSALRQDRGRGTCADREMLADECRHRP